MYSSENEIMIDECTSSTIFTAPEIYEKSCKYIIKDSSVLKSSVVLGKDVLSDVELIKSYTGDESTLLSILSQNLNMLGSRSYLENIISNPIDDLEILKERSQCLKYYDTKKNIGDVLKNIASYENDIVWMFERNTNEMSALYDMVYFSNFWLLNQLNKNSYTLTAYNLYRIIVSPIIGIVTPISYFIVPYLIIRYRLGIKISFYSYVKFSLNMFLSGDTFSILLGESSSTGSFRTISIVFTMLFYFHGILNSIEVSRMSYKVASLITNKMNNVVKFIKGAKKLSDEVWNDKIYSFFGENKLATHCNYFENEIMNLENFSLFRNFGNQMKFFLNFTAEDYNPLYQRVYMLDTIHALLAAKEKLSMCDAEFAKDSTKPIIRIKNVKHPFLVKTIGKNVVGNSIDFSIQNIILTGPNAGGKSTLIKSVILAILMAQTTTLVCSDSIEITPFKYINSQINIPDCKGKESLFEAEMYRSKENLEMLKHQDGHSFIAMDEIFNSTNPLEGVSGACAIAKKIANFEKNISLISTHYLYLTKLEKEQPERFANFKMNVSINKETNEIKFPYILNKGISKQYIALELLKKNGFDEELIDDAMNIKNSIVRSNKK